MANKIVKFNGKEYSIEETKFDPALVNLAQFLAKELAGSGATVKLAGTEYSISKDRKDKAAVGFTNYLDKISGDDYTVLVNQENYGLNKSVVDEGYVTVGNTLQLMAEGSEEPELIPSEGLEFGLLSDGASYALIGMGTCTDVDLVIPSHYNGLPVTRILTYSSFQQGESSPPEDPDEIPEVDYDREKYRGISLYNSNVRSMVIPGTVKTIEKYAFVECSHIESVILCEGVTSIEESAFDTCNNLANISIPSSVSFIGHWAFVNALSGSKQNIHIHINAPENSIAGAPWDAYSSTIYWNSTGPTAETMQSPRFVLNDDGASYCVANVGDYTSTDIVIPDTYNGLPVTTIAGHAFAYNTRITSVVIPDSVTDIWEDAFVDCYGLTSVTLGNGVTNIEYSAFLDCCALQNIIFNGTIAEWNAIEKGNWWNEGVPAPYVQCTDGQVQL